MAEADDGTVAPFADLYFEYDLSNRVTKVVAAGDGCSSCSGGQGTYTYSYTTSVHDDGFNSWTVKTIETLPDGNTNTVFTNAYGEVMLSAYTDTSASKVWRSYWEYDEAGRVVLAAAPSTVTGHSDSEPDLVNVTAGDAEHLHNSAGQVTVFTYAATTTATTTADGDATGYQKQIDLQRGENGTAVPQRSMTYIKRRTNYDALGRTTKTVENYVDGTVGDDNDKTTEYTYNAAGMTTLTALLTSGSQTTEWVYGVTTAGGNGLNSNDVTAVTRWPDPSTGAASSSQQDVVTVDALGNTKTTTDRNGTVHTLSYDVTGRLTEDAVTTLGSGVDGPVRLIGYWYGGRGIVSAITSYDAVSGGAIVNQVSRWRNDLGVTSVEFQNHSGAAEYGSPAVSSVYSEMAGGANHSRPLYVQYPNNRVITYDYGSTGGLNDLISRPAALKDGSTTLEGYDYLGLGTVVRLTHPQPGVDLTYIKQTGESDGDAGDKYAGLDRFGRVVDQRWINGSAADVDRYKYGYDRNGNRLYRENTVNAALSELYGYDNLNQVTSFDRGTLNGSKTGISGSPSRTQDWDFDAVGNWEVLNTNGTNVTRTHNRQNELTVFGSNNLGYDNNGNQLTDETGKQFVWDPWNRLVIVKNSGGTVIETHEYDGRNYRVSTTVAGGVTTDFYYSSNWQVVEERVSGTTTASYVWSPVYVDAMIARDRDTDANGSLDERLYPTRDANFNVTGLVNTSGTVIERFNYDPFGAATVMNASWMIGSTGYAWVYLHQGTRWDGVAEKYYVRERWYDADQGRWINNDPLRFHSGTNFYIYTSNTPLSHIDPYGLIDWAALGATARQAELIRQAMANIISREEMERQVPKEVRERYAAFYDKQCDDGKIKDKAGNPNIQFNRDRAKFLRGQGPAPGTFNPAGINRPVPGVKPPGGVARGIIGIGVRAAPPLAFIAGAAWLAQPPVPAGIPPDSTLEKTDNSGLAGVVQIWKGPDGTIYRYATVSGRAYINGRPVDGGGKK